MNKDFTYCIGKNCNLKENCIRYLEGKTVPSDGSFYWMEHCSEEYREAYLRKHH